MHKTRLLLLDRDGVVNIDHGYIGTVERFEFCPGLFSFLRAARDFGYRLAILTNQSGVARGLYSETDYNTITLHMLDGLRREGVEIDLTLACFAHPEGKAGPHKHESFWRKPNPGMVLEALRHLHGDAARSVFLGDSQRDMEAAQAGGIGTCLWLTDENPVSSDGVTIVRAYADVLTLIRPSA